MDFAVPQIKIKPNTLYLNKLGNLESFGAEDDGSARLDEIVRHILIRSEERGTGGQQLTHQGYDLHHFHLNERRWEEYPYQITHKEQRT